MRKILGCFIIIMIMITSQIFAGTIYYVDATNGNDLNDGLSEVTAWQTIAKVNGHSFSPGDFILFKRGSSWTEGLVISSSGIEGNPITFEAYGAGDKPILKNPGSSYERVIKINADYVKIININIKDAHESGVYISSGSDHNIVKYCDIENVGIGVRIIGQHNLVTNNYIHDLSIVVNTPGGDNDYGAVGVWFYNSNNEASYNTIENCRATSYDYGYDGGAFEIFAHNNIDNIKVHHNWVEGTHGVFEIGGTSTSYIVSNVEFYYNVCYNFYNSFCVIHTAGWFGITIDNFQVYNNTIIDTHDYAETQWSLFDYGTGDPGTNGVIFKNNIGYVNDYWFICAANQQGWNWTHTYNCFINNNATLGFTKSTGEIEENPDFIDLNNGDFRLQSVSPAIDAGVDLGYSLDFDDEQVPMGTEPDIGAYEYQGSVSPFSAEINASPTSGYVPLAVSFTGSASGGTAPYTYSWDFGDGNSSTDQNPSHTYSEEGDYTVIFTLTDDSSQQDTDSIIINASEETTLLEASCSASPTEGEIPFEVTFTGSASGGTAPYTYSWDFGDGSSSSDKNPSHTYSSAGTYTVTLTVTDSSSRQATDSLIITATSPTSALSASSSASPTSGEAPLTVNFTGSASGGTSPYTYSWDFGDGSSSSSQNPSHTYTSSGNYTVAITVTDSKSSTATNSLTINVQEKTSPLQASASASPTSGQVPLAVSFTGSASGGTAPYSYSWNFGDGSSSSAQNPSHTYSSAGSYNVTLAVTDSATSQASASIAITAQAQISALAASCTASPTSGDIPLTVNFTGTAAGGISPYAYSWNFGDGASSTAQNPSHAYTQAGSYTVTLTVTDSTASQATASTEVTASSTIHEVTVPDTPEGPSTGAPGVSYTYTTGGASCSQGHSIEYYFDWGDGTYSSWSSSTSASHIWSAAGTYAVKVQARCSVNPGVTSLWSEAKTVSLEESPNFQLYISSATASPASGQGGSTNPDTGTYPYPAGNTAQAMALPATNYRFSKWTGDISGSDSYNSEITFNMDQDKSISALFCTQCGDVNGDLSITPADAQDAFEMFLGIISNATETQKENADVNCDGTAAEPNITPADAQAIFEKFLGISELPGDCSCRSRADASSTAFTQNNRSQTASLEIQSGTPTIQLTIDDIDARFKREITVPVRINNPFNIKSFGFDLIFDSGTLEFAGIEIGSLLNGFTMVDANEISEGVVRVGGFSSEPIMTSSPSVLVRLKFRVSGRAKESSPLSITNTFDDIKNAATRPGVVFYKEINDKIMRNKNVF